MFTMITNTLRSVIRDEKGATAIEYGLIAAGIAVAIAATVFALGADIDALFTSIQTALSGG